LIKSNNTLTKKQHELVYKIFIAWYLHHNFVVIHPFANGNGRTARLLMCLILRYEGLSKVSYPILINYIINQDKSKYLNALNATDKGDYVSGVNYMFEVLDKAYRETTKKTKIDSY
jgi:Fic family protein